MYCKLNSTEKFKASNIVMEKLYRRVLSDYREHFKDATNPNIVYVTDMVSCSQKREFRIRYPELMFKFEPAHILGDMVHIGIEGFLKEEGFQVEVEFEKEISIDNREVKIKGRVDALNENYVVEIKTARSDLGIPHDHHLMQLQIYLNILNREKGILIYITPDRIAEFSIEKTPIDLEKLVKETIENIKHPRYSWECLHPNTLIFTPDGMKTIRLIKEGDKIIGMDKITGKYRVAIVTKVIRRQIHKNEQCFTIEPAGLNHIVITENHPIFVRFSKWGNIEKVNSYKQRGYYVQITSRTRCRIFTEPQWLTVKEIYEIMEREAQRDINDEYKAQPWIFIPYPSEVKYRPLDLGLTENLLWLLGLTVAEGFPRGKFSIVLTLGTHEENIVKRVEDIATQHGISYSSHLYKLPPPHGDEYVINLGVKWRKLADNFIEWEKDPKTGRYAPRKHFREKILYLPPESQRTIVEGMVAGDGHVYKDGMFDYTTTSPKLAYQLVIMLLRQKILPTLKSSQRQPGWGKHPIFHVRWTTYRKRNPQAWFIKGGVWVRIKRILPNSYRGEVYNIEVENIENYLTPAGIVHNCKYCFYARICPFKTVEK